MPVVIGFSRWHDSCLFFEQARLSLREGVENGAVSFAETVIREFVRRDPREVAPVFGIAFDFQTAFRDCAIISAQS